jgi:hypothetical protein
MESAIATVTQRMHDRFALDLITDCATMTATVDGAHAFLPIEAGFPDR